MYINYKKYIKMSVQIVKPHQKKLHCNHSVPMTKSVDWKTWVSFNAYFLKKIFFQLYFGVTMSHH